MEYSKKKSERINMARGKKRISEEEKLKKRRRQKKESMRRARAKLRQDPEKHEEEKRMHREQYRKRKEAGKVKPISQISDREKRKIRKSWRERAKKYREDQKLKKKTVDFLDRDTPPATPEPIPSDAANPVPLYESPMYLLNKQGVNRKESGKKIAKQRREQMKRHIKYLEEKLNASEKVNAKLRQRLCRFKKQHGNQESPRAKVSNLLKGTKYVSKTVRKKLLFSELLQSNIKSTYIRSNTAGKRILKSVTSGILEKYRCQGYFTSLTSRWKTTLSYGRTERKIKLEKLKEDVKAFLESDISSRLTAGRKETITRNKQKCQMRLLNDSLKSLHKKFLAAYPHYKDGDLTVSYPLFCKLHPFWILQPKAISRQTCLCKIYTNMALMVRSMKISKMIKNNTPQEVIKSICCTNMKEECLERTCQECNKNVITTLYYDPQAKIKFERWITKRVKVIVHGKEKISQKTEKETVECSKQELFKAFEKLIPIFMQHVNNVNHQYQIIRDIKKNLQEKEALLHIDFSENFNCKYAEEIQSTHFGSSKKQLSLHTSVLYYCNNKLEQKTQPLCFCTVSENLRHDAAAICIHLKPIFQELVKQVPQLKTLHILSDGPSTQYRNKKMFHLLGAFITKETGASTCVWHFSETSHGKGAPDGVGGTLKRTADNIIAQGHDITGQGEFVSLLKPSCPGIKVIGIDKDADAEMKKIDDFLAKINIPTFKGTMKVHQITWSKEKEEFLDVRRLSCITCKPEEKCIHFSLGQIHLTCQSQKQENETDDDHNNSKSDEVEVLKNKYVIVRFEGKKKFKKHYIGVVTEEHQNKCRVNFLRRSGNKVFSFPQQVDEEVVDKKNIIKVLKFPNMNTRGCFIFEEELTSFANLE